MENTDQIHSFIRLVMNENLAQAQSVIRDSLNEKLSKALDEKFEAYAPAIFEERDPKLADKNDDGTLSDWEVNSTKWAEEGGEEGSEENDEENDEETDEGDEQPMQTGGAGTAGSDGY